MADVERELLVKWLRHAKTTISPGNGIANARIIRDTCQLLGYDEDLFLPGYVIKDKKRWGLG